MITSDFHIQKEKQQKELNFLVQTIKNNHFAADLKEAAVKIISGIINAINKQREIIYKEIESFDFIEQYNHEDQKNVDVANKVYGHDTRSLQHEIVERLIKISTEIKTEDASNLNSPENTKLKITKQESDNFNNIIESQINVVVDMILNAHQTQQDATGEALEEEMSEDTASEDVGVTQSPPEALKAEEPEENDHDIPSEQQSIGIPAEEQVKSKGQPKKRNTKSGGKNKK